MPAPKRPSSPLDSQPKIPKLEDDSDVLQSHTAPATISESLNETNMQDMTAVPRVKKKLSEELSEPANSSTQLLSTNDSSKTISYPPHKKAKLLKAASASPEEAPANAFSTSEDELSRIDSKVNPVTERDDVDKSKCAYSTQVQTKRKAEELDVQAESHDLSAAPSGVTQSLSEIKEAPRPETEAQRQVNYNNTTASNLVSESVSTIDEDSKKAGQMVSHYETKGKYAEYVINQNNLLLVETICLSKSSQKLESDKQKDGHFYINNRPENGMTQKRETVSDDINQDTKTEECPQSEGVLVCQKDVNVVGGSCNPENHSGENTMLESSKDPEGKAVLDSVADTKSHAVENPTKDFAYGTIKNVANDCLTKDSQSDLQGQTNLLSVEIQSSFEEHVTTTGSETPPECQNEVNLWKATTSPIDGVVNADGHLGVMSKKQMCSDKNIPTNYGNALKSHTEVDLCPNVTSSKPTGIDRGPEFQSTEPVQDTVISACDEVSNTVIHPGEHLQPRENTNSPLTCSASVDEAQLCSVEVTKKTEMLRPEQFCIISENFPETSRNTDNLVKGNQEDNLTDTTKVREEKDTSVGVKFAAEEKRLEEAVSANGQVNLTTLPLHNSLEIQTHLVTGNATVTGKQLLSGVDTKNVDEAETDGKEEFLRIAAPENSCQVTAVNVQVQESQEVNKRRIDITDKEHVDSKEEDTILAECITAPEEGQKMNNIHGKATLKPQEDGEGEEVKKQLVNANEKINFVAVPPTGNENNAHKTPEMTIYPSVAGLTCSSHVCTSMPTTVAQESPCQDMAGNMLLEKSATGRGNGLIVECALIQNDQISFKSEGGTSATLSNLHHTPEIHVGKEAVEVGHAMQNEKASLDVDDKEDWPQSTSELSTMTPSSDLQNMPLTDPSTSTSDGELHQIFRRDCQDHGDAPQIEAEMDFQTTQVSSDSMIAEENQRRRVLSGDLITSGQKVITEMAVASAGEGAVSYMSDISLVTNAIDNEKPSITIPTQEDTEQATCAESQNNTISTDPVNLDSVVEAHRYMETDSASVSSSNGVPSTEDENMVGTGKTQMEQMIASPVSEVDEVSQNVNEHPICVQLESPAAQLATLNEAHSSEDNIVEQSESKITADTENQIEEVTSSTASGGIECEDNEDTAGFLSNPIAALSNEQGTNEMDDLCEHATCSEMEPVTSSLSSRDIEATKLVILPEIERRAQTEEIENPALSIGKKTQEDFRELTQDSETIKEQLSTRISESDPSKCVEELSVNQDVNCSPQKGINDLTELASDSEPEKDQKNTSAESLDHVSEDETDMETAALPEEITSCSQEGTVVDIVCQLAKTPAQTEQTISSHLSMEENVECVALRENVEISSMPMEIFSVEKEVVMPDVCEQVIFADTHSVVAPLPVEESLGRSNESIQMLQPNAFGLKVESYPPEEQRQTDDTLEHQMLYEPISSPECDKDDDVPTSIEKHVGVSFLDIQSESLQKIHEDPTPEMEQMNRDSTSEIVLMNRDASSEMNRASTSEMEQRDQDSTGDVRQMNQDLKGEVQPRNSNSTSETQELQQETENEIEQANQVSTSEIPEINQDSTSELQHANQELSSQMQYMYQDSTETQKMNLESPTEMQQTKESTDEMQQVKQHMISLMQPIVQRSTAEAQHISFDSTADVQDIMKDSAAVKHLINQDQSTDAQQVNTELTGAVQLLNEASTTVEQQIIEGSTTVVQQMIEGSTTHEQQMIEGSITEEQHVIESSTSEEQHVIEGSITEEQQMIEGSITEEQQMIEGSITEEQQMIEGSITEEQQMIEGSITEEQQIIEGSTTVVQQMIERSTTVVQQMIEGSTTQEQQMIEGSITEEQHVIEGSTTELQQMIEGSITEEQHVIEGSTTVVQQMIEGSITEEQQMMEGSTIEVQQMSEGSITEEQQMIEGSTTQEQHVIEGSTTEVQQMIEGSTTEVQQMIEGSITEEQHVIEASATEGLQVIEASTTEGLQVIEGSITEEQHVIQGSTTEVPQMIEGSTTQEQQMIEGSITEVQQMIEGSTTEVQIEGSTTVLQQMVEGSTTVLQQMIEGSTTAVQQMIEGSTTAVQQMIEGSTTQEQQMIKGSITQEQHVIEGSTTEVQQVIEASTTEEQQMIEGPSTEEQYVIETSKTEVQQIIEGSTTEEPQMIEESTTEVQQIIEGSTTEEPQMIEESTTEVQQIIDGPSTEVQQIIEGSATKEKQMIQNSEIEMHHLNQDVTSEMYHMNGNSATQILQVNEATGMQLISNDAKANIQEMVEDSTTEIQQANQDVSNDFLQVNTYSTAEVPETSEDLTNRMQEINDDSTPDMQQVNSERATHMLQMNQDSPTVIAQMDAESKDSANVIQQVVQGSTIEEHQITVDSSTAIHQVNEDSSIEGQQVKQETTGATQQLNNEPTSEIHDMDLASLEKQVNQAVTAGILLMNQDSTSEVLLPSQEPATELQQINKEPIIEDQQIAMIHQAARETQEPVEMEVESTILPQGNLLAQSETTSTVLDVKQNTLNSSNKMVEPTQSELCEYIYPPDVSAQLQEHSETTQVLPDSTSEHYVILEPVPDSEIHFDIITQAAAESGLSEELNTPDSVVGISLDHSQQTFVQEAEDQQCQTSDDVEETTTTESQSVAAPSFATAIAEDAESINSSNQLHNVEVQQEEVQMMEDIEIGREIVVAEEDNEEDGDIAIIEKQATPEPMPTEKPEETVAETKSDGASAKPENSSPEEAVSEKKSPEVVKPKKQEMNTQAKTKARLAALAEQKAAASKRAATRQQLNLLALCQEIAEDIATDSMLLKRIEEEKRAASKADSIKKPEPVPPQEAASVDILPPAAPESSLVLPTPTVEASTAQPSTADSAEPKPEPKPAAETPKRRFFISQVSVPLKVHEKKKLTRYQRLRQVELQREKMSWARMKKLKSDQANQMFSEMDWQLPLTVPSPFTVNTVTTTSPSPTPQPSSSTISKPVTPTQKEVQTSNPEPVKKETPKTEVPQTQPASIESLKEKPTKTEPLKVEPAKPETAPSVAQTARTTRQSTRAQTAKSAPPPPPSPKPAPKATRGSGKRSLPAVPPPMPNGVNAKKAGPIEYKPYRPRPKYSFDDFELDDDPPPVSAKPTHMPKLTPQKTQLSATARPATLPPSTSQNLSRVVSQTGPAGQSQVKTTAATVQTKPAVSPTLAKTSKSNVAAPAAMTILSKPTPSPQLRSPGQIKATAASTQAKSPASVLTQSNASSGTTPVKTVTVETAKPAVSEQEPAGVAPATQETPGPLTLEAGESKDKSNAQGPSSPLPSTDRSELPANTLKQEVTAPDAVAATAAPAETHQKPEKTDDTPDELNSATTTSQDGETPRETPLSDAALQKEVKKLKEADKDSSQTIIDAGQKHFGAVACNVCGMLYSAANPEDESQHLLFHNQFISAVKYIGWKKERILNEFPDGKIILVLPDDPKYALKKVEEIREMVDNDLGFQQVETKCPSKTKTFLFISNDKKVAGCLIAEHIQEGYRVIEDPAPQGSEREKVMFERQRAWCCSTKPEPAICGISRIWVVSMMRRKGIASRLLECLRNNFIYGSYLSKDEVAFSDPTPDGKLFATQYFGTSQFLVYNFVSGTKSPAPKTASV